MVYTSISAVLMSILTTDNLRVPINTLEDILEKRTHVLCVNVLEPVFAHNNMFTKLVRRHATAKRDLSVKLINYILQVNATPPEKVEILPKWKGILNGPKCSGSVAELVCKENTVVIHGGLRRQTREMPKQFPCLVYKSNQEYFKMYGRLSVGKKWPYIKNLNEL